MIRLSVNNDKDGIISLWKEAFCDSEEDITFFLERKYSPDRTLICEIDGEIASMLFLLEGYMCIAGKEYPSYYLYAACTAKKHRGKGLMADLLEFAKETANSRNKYYICLMPAEKSLFDFYAKFGYKSVFKNRILTVRKKDLVCSDNIGFSDSEFSDMKVSEIRNRAFEEFDYFKWDDNAINFAFEHNKLYSGECFENCNGYSLYSQCDNKVTVKEFAFTEFDFNAAVKNLFDLTSSDKIEIRLPADYNTEIGSYEISDSAMLLALNKEAENSVNLINNAYIGLTLD